jgi:hypothetical protein
MIEAEEEKRKAVVQGRSHCRQVLRWLIQQLHNRAPKKTFHGTTKSNKIPPLAQTPTLQPLTNHLFPLLPLLSSMPLRRKQLHRIKCHHSLLLLYLPRKLHPLRLRPVLEFQKRAMIWLVIRRNRPLRRTTMIPIGSRPSVSKIP